MGVGAIGGMLRGGAGRSLGGHFVRARVGRFETSSLRDLVLNFFVAGILAVVAAIEHTLKALGKPVEFGKGVAAAQKVLSQLF